MTSRCFVQEVWCKMAHKTGGDCEPCTGERGGSFGPSFEVSFYEKTWTCESRESRECALLSGYWGPALGCWPSSLRLPKTCTVYVASFSVCDFTRENMTDTGRVLYWGSGSPPCWKVLT